MLELLGAKDFGPPGRWAPPHAPAEGSKRVAILAVDRIDDVAKWSARAFTAVAALLTFFGIREGILDRVLRGHAGQALAVFALLGLGVVASVLAPALNTTVRVHAAPPLVAVAVMGVLASNVGDVHLGWWWFLYAGIVALLVFVALARVLYVSVVGLVLAVAVASTSLGLYSAAAIAVDSKLFRDQPRVTGTIETAANGEVVRVAVKASRRDGEDLVVLIHGYRGNGDTTGVRLGRVTFTPDESGDIDAVQLIPVTSPRWDTVAVSYCREVHEDDRVSPEPIGSPSARAPAVAVPSGSGSESPCSGAEVAEVLWLRRSGRGRPRAGARIAPGPHGTFGVTVSAVNVAPATAVRVRVVLRGHARRDYLAALAGDTNGTATWTVRVSGARAGDDVVAYYADCNPGCGKRVEILRYRVR